MVLSAADKAALEQAVQRAEGETSAELGVVVARASDDYGFIALAAGIIAGTLLGIFLHHYYHWLPYTLVICLQFAVAILFLILPFLRYFCTAWLPADYMRHKAQQRAALEYMHFIHHLPASAPVCLLYVSLAERYLHIYTSRAVREKIPEAAWEEVVGTLTTAMRGRGLRMALTGAVEHAGEILRLAFPAQRAAHTAHNVVEIDQ